MENEILSDLQITDLSRTPATVLYSPCFSIQNTLVADGDPRMNSAKFAAVIVVIEVIGCLTAACTSSETLTTNHTQPSASPATATAAATPDPLAEARLDFEKHCAVCHGEKGEGGTKEIEGRKVKVPSLRDGHALDHTDEKFVKQITEGD